MENARKSRHKQTRRMNERKAKNKEIAELELAELASLLVERRSKKKVVEKLKKSHENNQNFKFFEKK